MKTTINTKTAGQITINSNYTGNKLWPADDSQRNYNHHKITVTNNNKKLSFDFWGSIVNPIIDSESDNISALYCFLSDAIAGSETFTDFCSNCGYDEDSRKAYKTYQTCQKTYAKFERVFNCSGYDLINELQENYDL